MTDCSLHICMVLYVCTPNAILCVFFLFSVPLSVLLLFQNDYSSVCMCEYVCVFHWGLHQVRLKTVRVFFPSWFVKKKCGSSADVCVWIHMCMLTSASLVVWVWVYFCVCVCVCSNASVSIGKIHVPWKPFQFSNISPFHTNEHSKLKWKSGLCIQCIVWSLVCVCVCMRMYLCV